MLHRREQMIRRSKDNKNGKTAKYYPKIFFSGAACHISFSFNSLQVGKAKHTIAVYTSLKCVTLFFLAFHWTASSHRKTFHKKILNLNGIKVN
jgi:hypothetical protein